MRRAAQSSLLPTTTTSTLSTPATQISDAEGLRDRSSISSAWNTTPGRSDAGSAAAGGIGRGMDAVLEAENNHLQDELRSKIHALKYVTINIGTELRGQTGGLRDMGDDWDDLLHGALTKAMSRVKGLASGSQNNVVWYLILFSLFIFVMMWLLLF